MQALIDKIRRREARCGIIGLGYVGCRSRSSSRAPASTPPGSTSTRARSSASAPAVPTSST